MLHNSRKPLRMRAACTQCNSAKVRCSGEKAGCARCRRSGFQCEYLVSMVGRATKRQKHSSEQSSKTYNNEPTAAPSIRNNNTPPQELDQQDPFSTLDLELLPEISDPFSPRDYPTIPDIDSHDLNMFANYDNLAQSSSNLDGALWPSASAAGLPDHSHGPDISSSDLTSTLPRIDRMVVDGTSGISNLSDHQTGASPMPSLISHENSASSVRSQLSQTSRSRIPESYRDESVVAHYPQVTALMSIISRLESNIQQTNIPLDQTLKGNRMAMAQVRTTMSTTEFKSCQSCPTLVATIMDLIVGLYGLIANSLDHPSEPPQTSTEDENRGFPDLLNSQSAQQTPGQSTPGSTDTTYSKSRSGSPSDSSKEIPLVQFGCLEVDPETQNSFRKQILKEELRKCQQSVQFCKNDLQFRHVDQNQTQKKANKPSGTFSLTSSNRLQLQWYTDMEQQVNQLLDRLKCKYHTSAT